jgi:hypothetical protein
MADLLGVIQRYNPHLGFGFWLCGGALLLAGTGGIAIFGMLIMVVGFMIATGRLTSSSA